MPLLHSDSIMSFPLPAGERVEILREYPPFSGIHASYTATEAPLDVLDCYSLQHGCGWGAYFHHADGSIKRLLSEQENVLSCYAQENRFLLLSGLRGQTASKLMVFEGTTEHVIALPAGLCVRAAAFCRDGFWLVCENEGTDLFLLDPSGAAVLAASLPGSLINSLHGGFWMPEWEANAEGLVLTLSENGTKTRWQLCQNGQVHPLNRPSASLVSTFFPEENTSCPAVICLEADGGFDAPVERLLSPSVLTAAGYAVCTIHLQNSFSPFDENSMKEACAALEASASSFLQHPDVDACRFAVMGYGVGCLLLSRWLCSRKQKPQAVVMDAPVANWVSLSALSASGQAYVQRHSLSDDEQVAQLPLAQISQLSVPSLILHSRRDASIPLCESLSTLASLKLHGITAKLNVFDSFAQRLPHETEKLRSEEILAWLSRWMEV